jgi:glycosyltransferase involved in cell wall biosynthesis
MVLGPIPYLPEWAFFLTNYRHGTSHAAMIGSFAMRIGFDAKRAFCNSTGLGNYSRTLINNLAAFYPNEQYFLYTPHVDLNSSGFPPKNARVCLPKHPFIPGSLWRTFLLSRLFKRDRLDIYHGLSHEIPVMIPPAYRTFVTIHDLIYLRHPHFFPWIDRLIYSRKFHHACERADVIIAISEQTKRDIVEFFKISEEKIHVVYQSVNEHFTCRSDALNDEKILSSYGLVPDYILSVGSLTERKNQLNLVEAFSKLSKGSEQLVLIGNGDAYRKRLEVKIKQLDLENKVVILDRVKAADLPALYRGAKVMVYPSFFEGFGLPIVEALASGVPVVTSKGHCFPEAGGPSSMYVDPFDVDDIARGLEAVVHDEHLRKKMREDGLVHAKKFLKEETTKRLMELYKSACSLKGPNR